MTPAWLKVIAVILPVPSFSKEILVFTALAKNSSSDVGKNCNGGCCPHCRNKFPSWLEAYGRLDCAFNNAGIDPPSKPLHEQSIEDFDKLMAINVRGLFLCMKYEIQQMLSQGSGAIVNNSSIGGLIGFPGVSPYIASKHAVMGLTRSAALDYAKQGIRINAVNPGFIATDMIDRLVDQVGGTANDLASTVPMGRMGQAEEIAQAIVFLCSDAASYITGQPLVIDGGLTTN